MSYIKSLIIAFSMYSKIPMPHLELEEKDMRYVMGFFPVVGIVLGGVMYLLYKLMNLVGMPDVSASLILMIVPLIVTGGIHTDGYMDTCDARNSYGDMEKKLNILKDSHIGAFAVIRLLVYYALYYACVYCMVVRSSDKLFIIWMLTFYMSRIMSGYAAVNLKGARNKGMLHTFTSAADRRNVNIMLGVQSVICIVAMCMCDIVSAVLVMAAETACMLYYRHMAYKEFGGVTGDLAGYLLCISELGMLMVLSVISLILVV